MKLNKADLKRFQRKMERAQDRTPVRRAVAEVGEDCRGKSPRGENRGDRCGGDSTQSFAVLEKPDSLKPSPVEEFGIRKRSHVAGTFRWNVLRRVAAK